jgi:vancomycin resistance protein VanJ
MNLAQFYLFGLTLVRLIRRLMIAATQFFVLGVLSWHLLRFYQGDRWLPVRIGSYLAPWLMLSLVPALSIALAGRRRWLATLALVAISLFAGRYSYLFTPGPAIAGTPAETLKVMTFNVLYSNHDAQRIATLVRQEKPDIIAFQEFTPGLANLLQPRLAADYPYTLSGYMDGFALALASRYPLAEAARPPQAQRTLRATVQTPAGPVDLWNIHPVVALSSDRWQIQREILEAVAGEVARATGPVIVLGDFNTMDQAENYELIAAHLVDVYQVAGQGFGFTFPEPVALPPGLPWYAQPLRLISPVVRIDHIMVSAHFTAQEAHVIPESAGSDRRPLVATLQLKR